MTDAERGILPTKQEAVKGTQQLTGDDAPELDEDDEIALDRAAELCARRWLADPKKYGKENWPGLEILRKHYGINE